MTPLRVHNQSKFRYPLTNLTTSDRWTVRSLRKWAILAVPKEPHPNDYYSRATVRYLWNLHQRGKISELSPDLRRAASEGTALADQAAEAHGIERLPRDVQSAADAYAAATSGDASSAEKYFAEALDFSGDDVTVQGNSGRVDSRATLAYAAASFIAMSQLEKGVRLANQVTRQVQRARPTLLDARLGGRHRSHDPAALVGTRQRRGAAPSQW